ncbi:MAG: hypothetical protein A2754_01500 [Candidatus Magasanikbacteria bacterium RIFCSPHIGHO2_01_FULL_47_8]|uniref:Uncharacterized protein n=1 Tax=Candidatus Magasanikbacteria bacterium RIFCSPHIGHO2_01_FULL_47_8 TaxID=1798673 RepID=A0A1F6MC19_9BACT|nr:MAG: hypothetical protein A2754_01500 [Candidatus Magasanikbacteria bacterium RIFCSPHIGHO2_01_FULL_47_8]
MRARAMRQENKLPEFDVSDEDKDLGIVSMDAVDGEEMAAGEVETVSKERPMKHEAKVVVDSEYEAEIDKLATPAETAESKLAAEIDETPAEIERLTGSPAGPEATRKTAQLKVEQVKLQGWFRSAMGVVGKKLKGLFSRGEAAPLADEVTKATFDKEHRQAIREYQQALKEEKVETQKQTRDLSAKEKQEVAEDREEIKKETKKIKHEDKKLRAEIKAGEAEGLQAANKRERNKKYAKELEENYGVIDGSQAGKMMDEKSEEEWFAKGDELGANKKPAAETVVEMEAPYEGEDETEKVVEMEAPYENKDKIKINNNKILTSIARRYLDKGSTPEQFIDYLLYASPVKLTTDYLSKNRDERKHLEAQLKKGGITVEEFSKALPKPAEYAKAKEMKAKAQFREKKLDEIIDAFTSSKLSLEEITRELLKSPLRLTAEQLDKNPQISSYLEKGLIKKGSTLDELKRALPNIKEYQEI